jgi:hypothetical protein
VAGGHNDATPTLISDTCLVSCCHVTVASGSSSSRRVSWFLTGRGCSPKFPPLESFFVRDLTSLRFFALLISPTDYSKTLLPLRRWHSHTVGMADHAQFHPLQRGNRYMSRREGMTHTNARALSLADFQFALILPRNSHAAPPTEDECSPPRLVWTAIPSSSRVSPEPAQHQSFP